MYPHPSQYPVVTRVGAGAPEFTPTATCLLLPTVRSGLVSVETRNPRRRRLGPTEPQPSQDTGVTASSFSSKWDTTAQAHGWTRWACRSRGPWGPRWARC